MWALRPALGMALGWLLACLLADLLWRVMGLGAQAHGPRTGRRVALTFDDGPGAITPELLALLERHEVTATFFVTRAACQAHPAGLRALLAAGHQVESHGARHRHALTLTPWAEWAQLRWRPTPASRLYRPPYGGHSPFTRLLARLAGQGVTLWDVESRDWLTRDPAELARHSLAAVRGGSVVLLHDGPARTLPLLEALIPALTAQGYRPVPLRELELRPLGWPAAWARARRLFFQRGGQGRRAVLQSP